MSRFKFVVPVLTALALGVACSPVSPDVEPRDPSGSGSEAIALAERVVDPDGGGEIQFQTTSETSDPTGLLHVRLVQTWRGLQVIGAEGIAHIAEDGSASTLTDHFLRDIDPSGSIRVSAEEAIAQVVAELGGVDVLTSPPEAELVVFRSSERDHLAWEVRAARVDGSALMDAPVVLIDSLDGRELFRHTLLMSEAGSGTSTWSGEVSLEIGQHSKGYVLEDETRRAGTWSMRQGGRGAVVVGSPDTVFDAGWLQQAVDVHFGTAATLDYFQDTLGREGIDGAWGPTNRGAVTLNEDLFVAYANFGNELVNAFWYRNFAAFGDGDGTYSDALTTLDVVGHELTHGMVQFTAGLVYADESGALNESFADVFGNLVERSVYGDSDDNYLVGELCWTPDTDGDALRYMKDPTADGSSRDHYKDRYMGSQDNGGVHWNSGIGNLAFALVADGGSHPTYGGVTVGIGPDDAAQIWYRALNVYLTSMATFADARDATEQAAVDLYGDDSMQAKSVRKAWSMVGVG